ncbi:MAG: hypothetical protein ACRDJU_15390, partial [Actinomycetota bacterium]
RIDSVPGKLAKLATSYTTASEALTSFAAALGAIQQDADTLLPRLETAQTGVTSAHNAVLLVPSHQSAATQEQALQSARQGLNALQSQVEDLRDRYQAAEKKAVAAIHEASKQGIQNESWGWFHAILSAISDAISHIQFVLAVAAIVIVVVVLIAFTGPIGFLAALGLGLEAANGIFDAMFVLGTAQFGADGANKYLLGGNSSISTAHLLTEGILTLGGEGLGKGAEALGDVGKIVETRAAFAEIGDLGYTGAYVSAGVTSVTRITGSAGKSLADVTSSSSTAAVGTLADLASPARTTLSVTSITSDTSKLTLEHLPDLAISAFNDIPEYVDKHRTVAVPVISAVTALVPPAGLVIAGGVAAHRGVTDVLVRLHAVGNG